MQYVMASSTKMWVLLVLALCCSKLSIGQDLDRDRLAILYSSSSQLEYKTADTDDQNVGESEEVSVVGLGDLNSKNDAMSALEEKILEAMEQPATRKKAPCVGCPTDIDVGIAENRKILLELLKAPLAAMNAESPFDFGPANIVAATKQVESGVRYVITFETVRSSCRVSDSDSNGEECAEPQSLSHLCVVEVLAKLDGMQEVTSTNCSEARQVLHKNLESDEDSTQGSFSEGGPVPERDSIQINDDEIDGLSGALDSSSEDDSHEVQNSHVRDRRSANLGALKDVDKSEQKLISQFAELAVKTLDEVDPDNMKQIILEITEAKKQIVNGIMYHLVLRVGTSSCQEDDASTENANCIENQLYPERVCRVQIHRSWADESPLNAQVVKSECVDLWPQESTETLSAERTRRSSQDNWPSTEGWKMYNLQGGSQEGCFDKVMTSFQDLLNVKDVAKVATVRDAHTRVNKETNQLEMVVTIVLTDPTKLKMMGNIKKPMVVSSRVICSQRLKRSPGVPGGLSDVDVNDPQVVEISKFAMSDIQKSINSPYQHNLVRVVEARRQVVAGTLYHLKLEVAPTSCPKSEQSSQTCTTSNTENPLICTLKVWDQPWTQKREVQELNCGPSRSKREEHHVLGGPEHVESDNPYVKELASFAVTEIDKGLNSPYQQKVLRVVEAKSQVVAGTLMHLKLELVTTNCLKSEKVGSENCVHDPDQTSTMCSVKVWDRPWLKQREVQDVQCGRSRSKREASGSENSKFLKVDVKDPYILETANYALAELDKSTNTPYRHKILHILSAEVQHTGDTNVKLILDVGYSTCRKSSQSNNCALLKEAGQKLCHAELKHVVHLHERHITSMDCSNSHVNNLQPHNNHLIGGDDVDAHSALFRQFMHRWNKTYPSDAELYKRFNIFRENLKEIDRLQKGEQGSAVYGHTLFADLTPKEFKEQYMGLRQDLRQENSIPMRLATIPNIKLPPSFDWRDHNAVTPVKNQGACGSCWAFAVTGNIEGQNAIKHGKLISLSEQELVDCDTLDDGCKGGLPENAYHALEQLGGIETESDYPYDAQDEQCHFNKSEVKVQVTSSVNITTNEDDMAKWLVKNGPIAIGINANAMQFYVGGVSHPFKFLCNPGSLDHGVLVVGFGVHTTSIRHKVLPYWLIKNSWGTFWGEKGYYRVYRGDGTCGVNQMASSAVIE